MSRIKFKRIKLWLYPRLGIHRVMWRAVRGETGRLVAIRAQCMGCKTSHQVYMRGRNFVKHEDRDRLVKEFCALHAYDRRRDGTA